MGFESARRRRRGRVSFGAGCVVLIATAFLASCIIDKDKSDRCSEGQVYVEETLGGIDSAECLCAPGSMPNPSGVGCIGCGEHQSVMNGKCACDVGYSAASDGGVCEKVAIGAACGGASDCSEPFAYCAQDGDDHYCSADSCDESSCPTGFACQPKDGDTPSYCKKLPKGLGASCMSSEDCASGEAKFCDTTMTHSCILTGCASGDVKCPGYYGCCDLNSLVAGLSVCTPPSGLTDGKCPFGTLVNP